MLLKGNFESFFLTSILQLLYNDQKSGILRLKNEGNEIKIIFKEGDIVYAVGSAKETRLSFSLLKKGLVSKSQVEECLRLAKTRRQSLEKVLAEQGFVSREDMQDIINKHVEEIVFKLFLWEKGEFEYQDASINLRGAAATRLNTTKVLLEASRRIDEMSIIRKQIASDKQSFKISETIQDKEEVKLNAEEWRILSLIDGTRSVRQVVEESGYDEFVVYKVLYSLVSSGLINGAEILADKSDGGESKQERVEFKEHVAFYSAIIMVYLDVLHVVRSFLEKDLGKNARTIFNESKPENSTSPKTDIFRDFDPANPHATNIYNILEAMKAIQEFEEGRLFLVKNLNDFFRNILNRVPEILGADPSLEMIEKIEETIGHVDKYQGEAIGKTYIINDIRDILARLQERIVHEREFGKSGVGKILTFFRRKNGLDF
jgi:hypothetical protein